MNEIERQIEGDFEEENKVVKEENNNIKFKNSYNRNNDKNNKIILYVLLSVLVFVLLDVIIYFVFLRSDDNSNNAIDNDNSIVDDVITDNVSGDLEENNIAYVTCDDNAALLNVRNSPTGDIIDGLSCYKEITIEDEVAGTDNCPKWYKISYKKRGSNYTGYSCSTYIKKNSIGNDITDMIELLIDKANNYYEGNVLKAYCGYNLSNEKKEIEFEDDGNIMKGEYIKSEYNSLNELKNFLLSFMDESVFTTKLFLSDINNPKYYDNYYEIDGNLYCRNYSGKGWMSYYTGNYDYEVVDVTDNKISINIAYEYLNDNITDDDKCNLNNLVSCTNSKFNYDLGKIIIEKDNDDYIITKMDFHK